MYDDTRFSDSRGDFHFEDVHNRRLQQVDLAAVLKRSHVGELAYFKQIGELWSASRLAGIGGLGAALLALVDAEEANRELERARTLAVFDAVAAESMPEPLRTGSMVGIERWSEQPPD